ncbi:MAG TPA: hypothetical protein DHV29_00995 [Bacteroidales bacterium]|nr:hypothetical protein [Bacteroidales bacterium]HCY22044.1 hypothetical protein [Bacteroidales bacterium]
MEIFEAEIIAEFYKKMQSYGFLEQQRAFADKITFPLPECLAKRALCVVEIFWTNAPFGNNSAVPTIIGCNPC